MQWRNQNFEKVKHIKGRLLYRATILYNYVPFEMGISLKVKNLLTEGTNSFFYEQFLKVWKTTFTTLGELPWVLLFLFRTYVYCVMGATPMRWVSVDIKFTRLGFEKACWITRQASRCQLTFTWYSLSIVFFLVYDRAVSTSWIDSPFIMFMNLYLFL